MKDSEKELDKKIAIDCFNATWDLIDKDNRTTDEDRQMIHTAHASLYHWMQAGTPLEFARGEWIISRVYSLLNMGDSALYHAEASLKICLDNGIQDFDLSFGYEAVARAFKILKEKEKMQEYLDKALKSADKIAKSEDKEYALSQINDINNLD